MYDQVKADLSGFKFLHRHNYKYSKIQSGSANCTNRSILLFGKLSICAVSASNHPILTNDNVTLSICSISYIQNFLHCSHIKIKNCILTLNSDSPTLLGTWESAIFVNITTINSLSSKASIIEEKPWITALQWAWYRLFAGNSFLGTSLNGKSCKYAGWVSKSLEQGKTNENIIHLVKIWITPLYGHAFAISNITASFSKISELISPEIVT